MPSMPATWFSMMRVIFDSMTVDEAPRYVVLIPTTGALMSGYSRTAKRPAAMKPMMVSNALITTAKTGRRTETSERSTGLTPSNRVRKLFAAAETHRLAVAHLLRALGDHKIA